MVRALSRHAEGRAQRGHLPSGPVGAPAEGVHGGISSWVAEPIDGQVVAFDGKSIRGALKRSPLGMLHQAHVWACAQRLLLARTHVTGAPEGPDAVRRLLELIELKGAIVTGDAAHCSKASAQAILDAQGDYLLQLKGNRAALHARVVEHFERAELTQKNATHAKTVEEAHGRREIRQAWAVSAAKVDLGEIEWPRLASITMVERTREANGSQSVERHYYLSSFPPRARRLLDAVRQHWRVENDLHWSLDVQFDEDACAVYDETGATNLGCLRRVALMMLKRDTLHKRGLEAKRAKASRNTDYLEHVLRLGIS